MAKLHHKLGITSLVLRCFIPDSASIVGAGKAGLTFSSSGLIISTICDNEATPTTYSAGGSTIETITTLGTYAAPTATKCRFKEVDATNFPGVYEIQIADARFNVTNARNIMISVQVTGGAPSFMEIQFSHVPVNVLQINGDATAPVNLALAYNGTGYADGTLQAATGTTATLAAGASAVDNYYKNMMLQPIGGTGGGQAPRLITGYVGSTKVATLGGPAWATTCDNTTTYALLPFVDVFRSIVCESAGSYTAQQILSTLMAALAGTNPSSGTYKTPDGSANRIVGTGSTSAPFRSGITITPSS